MAKDKSTTAKPSHVLIFVEGETDEVFFKTLMEYYASMSDQKLPPYDICNLRGVTRYTSKLLANSGMSIYPQPAMVAIKSKPYAVPTIPTFLRFDNLKSLTGQSLVKV